MNATNYKVVSVKVGTH